MEKYKISYILLASGWGGLLVFLFCFFICYIKYKGIKSSNVNGYDICKRLVDNRKIIDVNIVEVRNGSSNIYNVDRRVIRLSVSSYYGNNCYNLAVSSFLAGLCVLADEENNNIKYIRRVFSKMSFISISSVIVMLVSYLFSGYYAVVGLIILVVMFIYQYLKKCISNDCILLVSREINEMDGLDVLVKEGIVKVLAMINFSYSIGLIICILQISRLFIYMV